MRKLQLVLAQVLLCGATYAQTGTAVLSRLVHQDLQEEGVLKQTVDITNLEILNSSQLDYSPTLYPEGIIFTSDRPVEKKKGWKRFFQKKYADLFYATHNEDGSYNKPEPLPGKINGRFNEGASTVDATGTFMVFTRNNNNGRNGFGQVELKLYYSHLKNNKWTKGKELPFNCEECTTSHPSLSPDGQQLYFASNRPGGYGGMDLYVVEKIDGKWSEPSNLGSKVNTVENEVFPFIHADGTLYYSSNGRSGAKTLDILFNRPTESGWSDSQALGQPFNSNQDDFGFIMLPDGNSGFFSSNRIGGQGMDDIYAWKLRENVAVALRTEPIRFEVRDEWTNELITNAEVELVEFTPGASQLHLNPTVAFLGQVSRGLMSIQGKHISLEMNEQGAFEHLPKFQKDYVVIIKKPGFLPLQHVLRHQDLEQREAYSLTLNRPFMMPEQQSQQMHFALASEMVTEELLQMSSNNESSMQDILATHETETYQATAAKTMTYEQGQRFQLDNIYYGYNQFNLEEDSKVVLNEVLEMMQNFPDMRIKLLSHTDSRGGALFNKTLSQHRAEAARRYLVSQGIDPSRLEAEGVGEKEPLFYCENMDCDEAYHQRNRRTEVVVLQTTRREETMVRRE